MRRNNWYTYSPGVGNEPTPVFLPGKFHGERSLEGYSHGVTESGMIERARTHTHTHTVLKPSCTNTTVVFFTFSSVQLLSCIWLFVTPWTAACQASLSITNCQSLPKPTSIELVMPSNHLILCHPLLCLPSIFPSISVFSNESALCIRWPKYWSFSFIFTFSTVFNNLQ